MNLNLTPGCTMVLPSAASPAASDLDAAPRDAPRSGWPSPSAAQGAAPRLNAVNADLEAAQEAVPLAEQQRVPSESDEEDEDEEEEAPLWEDSWNEKSFRRKYCCRRNSWCSHFWAHLGRLNSSHIFRVKLLPHEKKLLIDKEELGIRASQYVAWRCSLLATGAFFFTLTVAINVLFLIDPWNSGAEGNISFLLSHVALRYHKFFDNLVLLNRAYSITLQVASVFAVIFAFGAAWNWPSMRRSDWLVKSSFACSFLPPFILLLVLPFRHSVDFEGIQRQMCIDTLNGTQGMLSFARNVTGSFMGSKVWPNKIGGLANELMANYGLRVPFKFCDEDPLTWGDELAALLDTRGFLFNVTTNTCPRAEQQIQDMLVSSAKLAMGHAQPKLDAAAASAASAAGAASGQASAAAAGAAATANIVATSPGAAAALGAAAIAARPQGQAAVSAGSSAASDAAASQAAAQGASGMAAAGAAISEFCGPVCSNCTTSCLPHLTKLGALSSIYSLQALKGMSLGMASQCTHCFSWESACARNCSDVVMALSRQAVSGKAPERSRVCIKPEDLESFTLLVELGTQTSYWKMLLGSIYAAVSLSQLLPLTFSLLFGSTKGSTISKSVMPYSRLPDVIGTSAAVFTFPFIFQIAVLLQNTVGDHWTLIGVIMMLLGIFSKMNPRKMQALKEEDFKRSKKWLDLTSKVTLLLALVLFIVAVISSGTLSKMYELLKKQGIELSEDQKDALGQQFTWLAVRMTCMVLGKSLISAVFFTDGVVDIMDSFHQGDDTDPMDIQCMRMQVLDDLHTLFDKQTEDACLQPEDEVADGETGLMTAIRKVIVLHKEQSNPPDKETQGTEQVPEASESKRRKSAGKNAMMLSDAAVTLAVSMGATRSAPASSGGPPVKAPASPTAAKRDARTVFQWIARRKGRSTSPEQQKE